MTSPQFDSNITRIKKFTLLLSTLKSSDLDAIDRFLDGLRGITMTLPVDKSDKTDTQDMKAVEVDDDDHASPWESTDEAPRLAGHPMPYNKTLVKHAFCAAADLVRAGAIPLDWEHEGDNEFDFMIFSATAVIAESYAGLLEEARQMGNDDMTITEVIEMLD